MILSERMKTPGLLKGGEKPTPNPFLKAGEAGYYPAQ